MAKTNKREPSEKQLAHRAKFAEAARNRRKKIDLEDEFEPTEVQEAKLATATAPELAEPVVPEGAEITDVLPTDNQPTPTPTTPAVDPNLVATIVAAVIQAQRQFPQVAAAPAEAKFEELENTLNTTQNNRSHSARLGAGGEVQGIVFRYEVDKGYYPDPTDRLLSEPRLARFAMKENFIFRWSIDGVEYKKNNITYAEPRFTLELFRKLYDEDGLQNGKAALVARQMLHEDEFTTKIMAMKMGILDNFEDNDEGFRALMNEIRYQRFQQWLFAIFTPPKIETHRKRPLTQVIDGKAVEVYDTEVLTDKDRAATQSASLQSQAGIGSITVPQ